MDDEEALTRLKESPLKELLEKEEEKKTILIFNDAAHTCVTFSNPLKDK